jgi:hypothetical protein
MYRNGTAMGARCDPCLLVGVGERIQLDYYCVHWSLFGMGWVLNVDLYNLLDILLLVFA